MARKTPKPAPHRPAGGRRPAGGPANRGPLPRRTDRPWGWITTLAVMIVAAVTLIAYIATRPSATDIAGVSSYPNLPRDHVPGTVNYPQTPPAGGNHAPVPLTCGIYDQPVPNENAVHSLEHGALWITYQPALPGAQLATLQSLVRGNDHRLLSPYPGLPAPIVATAWGEQLAVSTADDPRLAKFASVYTQGPTTPELGAPCQGVGTPAG